VFIRFFVPGLSHNTFRLKHSAPKLGVFLKDTPSSALLLTSNSNILQKGMREINSVSLRNLRLDSD